MRRDHLMPRNLACPNCGSTKLTIWDTTPVWYAGAGAIVLDTGEREPDYGSAYDSGIGEGGDFTDLTCNECFTVGLTLAELVETTESTGENDA